MSDRLIALDNRISALEIRVAQLELARLDMVRIVTLLNERADKQAAILNGLIEIETKR